jgi:hypothetical protein
LPDKNGLLTLHSQLGRIKKVAIRQLNGAKDKTSLGIKNGCGWDRFLDKLQEFIDTTGLR